MRGSMDAPLTGLRKKIHMLAENTMRQYGECPVLDRGSEPWLAWKEWRRANGLGVAFMESREQWTVPTTWPPTDIDQELKATKGKGKLSDRLDT